MIPFLSDDDAVAAAMADGAVADALEEKDCQ